MSNNKLSLLFDDECPLCLRFSQALRKLDSNNTIDFYSIHDNETFIKFPQLSPEACHSVVHLIDTDQNIHRGAEIIPVLAATLPMVAKFAWLVEGDMGKKASELFYSAISNYRESLLNRCTKCKKVRKENCKH